MLREERRLSQVELAAAIDVDVRTIRRIESGNCNTTLHVIASLSDLFNVSVSELFQF